MKKNYFLLLIALAFNISGYSQTIFSQNFEGTSGVFPAGWTLFNVDGLTPNTSVSYVTNAWVARTDLTNSANSVALSTSWYTPAGTSNDWMMTPAITLTSNNILSWDAVATDAAFADGYEVRMSTTTPTVAASTIVLFSSAAENNTFTNHTVNLAAYAGQTVYISWRNNSTDKFVLQVDNISVTSPISYNASVVATSNKAEYTRIPYAQAGTLNSNVTVSNLGAASMTNLVVTLNVTDALSAVVHTETSAAIPTLAAGASLPVTFTGYAPTTNNTFTFTYVLTSAETDSDLTNNTSSYTKTIGTTYARDTNIFSGPLGIGAGNGGQLGQEYEIFNSAGLESVSFVINNSNGALTGSTTYATIWSMTAGGLPNAIVAQTVPVTITSTVDNLYTAAIVGGNYILIPGTYLVAIEEGTLTMQLQQTASIFTPGTVWVNWPTIPTGTWTNVETFGSSFSKSFVIRPNFIDLLNVENNSLTANDITLYPNPVVNSVKILNSANQNLLEATIYDISGRIVSVHKLDNNSVNDLDVSKLTSGNYIITIQSENGKVSKKLIVN